MASALRSGALVVLSFLLLLCLNWTVGADGSISEDGSATSGQRRLLQNLTPCPYSTEIEGLDFSPITSVCTNVTAANICCGAFLNFTCPRYALIINDLSTDCNQLYFAYLGNAGHYPGGYWAGICNQYTDGVNGLPCPSQSASPAPSPSHADSILLSFAPFLALLGFQLLLQCV